MDNFLANTLSLVIQPKQNFHFRYVSELKNTHGVLTGQLPQTYRESQNNVIEDTYPTIRLQLPANGHLDENGNKRDFFILCSLHSHNNEPQSLSPHLLLEKCNRTPKYDFIFAPMEENKYNPLERTWELKDYVIVRLKPDDYQQSLSEKRRHYESLQLPLDFDRLRGDLNMNDPKSVKTSGILNVCLGFTIFERNLYTNEYRLYKETIYSDNIYHGDDLRIHELCNTKGPIAGGTKVHILIKIQSGYKYFVRMFKLSSNMADVAWETFVPITSDDIFSNAAITFTLPPGPTNMSTDEVEVAIEIIVENSTYKSKAAKFWYLNTNDMENGRRKRPRMDASTSSPVQVTQVVTLPNIYTAIDPNLMHFNSCQQEVAVTDSDNSQNTITFYDMDDGNMSQEAYFMSPNSYNDAFLNVNQLAIHGEEQYYNESQDDFVQRLVAENLELLDGDNDNVESSKAYYSRDRCEPIAVRQEREMKKKETPTKTNDISAQIKTKIDQISSNLSKLDDNTINIKGLNVKSGNTVFHDALVDMDTLLHLYRQQKKFPKLKQLILKARNEYRQNLLHYACVLDRASCIRPLVGMGIALHAQDSLGRTPLHIAIEHGYNNDCLHKIQQLLEDHSKYPADVEKQLIQMFQVYSHKGHTVLHAAAIENLVDLVEIMLKFCKSHNMNILQYEALGNGDSVVHLIAKRNLVGMVKLMRQYIPEYLTIQNYPGQSVLDLPELSSEMLKALTDLDEPDLSKQMSQALNIK